MDWNDVDLNFLCDRESNLIDPLSFDTLLLEIHCNIKDINAATVTAQFEEDLTSRIEEARDIFKANLKNIVKKAQADRARP